MIDIIAVLIADSTEDCIRHCIIPSEWSPYWCGVESMFLMCCILGSLRLLCKLFCYEKETVQGNTMLI